MLRILDRLACALAGHYYVPTKFLRLYGRSKDTACWRCGKARPSARAVT